MSKVKIGFSGLTVTVQVERARLITGRMTGNANYTTPNPTLAEVIAATDALETAYIASRSRDKNLMAAMRLRRKELLFEIVQLGAYVQEASEGDEEIILSSGFDVVAPRTPRSDTAGDVLNVRVAQGSSEGKAIVKFDKATNAVLYHIEVAGSGSSFNTFDGVGITSKLQKEIGDLTPGSTYAIRVTALGREERGSHSDPVMYIAR